MWFKLLLPHQHYPLAAMVGRDGKLCFRLVDVGALLGRSKLYEFSKRFNNLVIQGKDVLPPYKRYPIMTQKSKLMTLDVVFSILDAELSLLAASFASSPQMGFALLENPGNLFVESYKTSPVLQVQDSPIPNSILVGKWIQDFIQKVQDMRQMQSQNAPKTTSLKMAFQAFLRAGVKSEPPQERATAESANPPERIPLPLVESTSPPERIPTPLVESESPPENIPTPPAASVSPPEKIPTPLLKMPLHLLKVPLHLKTFLLHRLKDLWNPYPRDQTHL